jgi:hypothetical protein
MHAEDPDRAAILARRQRFILLALTGAAPLTAACSQPCLSAPGPYPEPWLGPDPTTTVCPAKVGEPVSMFDSLEIRLPEGITPETLVENTSFVVARQVESVGCIDSLPGATISYFAVFFFAHDPSKSMPVVRDEVLAALGYSDPSFSFEVNDEIERSYEVVIDAPAPDFGPARAYLRLVANGDVIYAVIYEAHPAAWNALEASLRASAASLSFSPP